MFDLHLHDYSMVFPSYWRTLYGKTYTSRNNLSSILPKTINDGTTDHNRDSLCSITLFNVTPIKITRQIFSLFGITHDYWNISTIMALTWCRRQYDHHFDYNVHSYCCNRSRSHGCVPLKQKWMGSLRIRVNIVGADGQGRSRAHQKKQRCFKNVLIFLLLHNLFLP